jgi:hypothetical protein
MDEQKALSNTRVILTVLAAAVLSQVVSWLAIPILNDVIATTLVGRLSHGYWTVRLTADLLLSFASDLVITLSAIRITRENPIHIALAIGVVGFLVWYAELGDFSCLGSCGLPLWYDLLAIPNQFLGAAVAAFVALSSSNDSNSSPIRDPY